jgi:hypothetical protein
MIVDGFVCTSSYKGDLPRSHPANGRGALSKSALFGVDCTWNAMVEFAATIGSPHPRCCSLCDTSLSSALPVRIEFKLLPSLLRNLRAIF